MLWEKLKGKRISKTGKKICLTSLKKSLFISSSAATALSRMPPDVELVITTRRMRNFIDHLNYVFSTQPRGFHEMAGKQSTGP